MGRRFNDPSIAQIPAKALSGDLVIPVEGFQNGRLCNTTIQSLGEFIKTSTPAGTSDATSQEAIDARVMSVLAGAIKRFTLTGGVESTRVDDGVNYVITTFTIPTGFGSLEFEEIGMSRAANPYTKEKEPEVTRTGVDNLRV